jgi:hypothetical protein
LGEAIDPNKNDLNSVLEHAYIKNNWFTQSNVSFCLSNWSKCLNESDLTEWLSDVTEENPSPKTVGIVFAGNIPMVGFHDLLSVLCTGHKARVKLSQNDEVLMKFVIDKIAEIDAELGGRIEVAERIVRPDAVIATGSNNTARYFEYYYRDIPHVIRKNRTSVAVLSGKESDEELDRLADDVFQYFGLGCRNVTKLLIPAEFDITRVLDHMVAYENIIDHNKYANNYTYHKAIYLMNLTEHLDTGYILVKEDENLHSPLGCIYYERYTDLDHVKSTLSGLNDEIQVVVSSMNGIESQPFGTTQATRLDDYADGVNTLNYLTVL